MFEGSRSLLIPVATTVAWLVLSTCSDRDAIAPQPVLSLNPDSVVLLRGETLQLKPESAGRELSKQAIQWSSSDTAVASVTSDGLVNARKRGIASITAQAGSAIAIASITVDTVAELQVSKVNLDLAPGDTVTVTARLVGSYGFTFARAVVWASSEPAVADVAADGHVSALQPGFASIWASFGPLNRSISLFVVGADQPACRGPGPIHSGAIDTATWRASGGPHHLVNTTIVRSRLTVEAGAVVCALPDALLQIKGTLSAIGTPANRIRFLSLDPSKRWRGIEVFSGEDQPWPANGTLTEVVVEMGAVTARYASSIQIDRSHFRMTSIRSNENFSSVELSNSVVDTGNVVLSAGRFSDNVIRYGQLGVARWLPLAPIALNGGRIEGSPGVAFAVLEGRSLYEPPAVTSTKPLRIVGSQGNPVSIPIGMFYTIWPKLEDQDSLLGNVNDTLVISASGYPHVFVRRDVPWRLTRASPVAVNLLIDTLTIEPGGSLKAPPLVLSQFIARGIQQRPIRITGADSGSNIRVTGSGRTDLSYVVLSQISLRTEDHQAVMLDHAESDSPIDMAASGATITNLEIHDVHTASIQRGALRIGAPGVVADRVSVRRGLRESKVTGVEIAASDVKISNCDIADNDGDGVLVTAGANIQINNCNIERNAGWGVNNAGGFLVDARYNWWGDSAGPNGPTADGINGLVDASAWFASPRSTLATARRVSAGAPGTGH